VLLWCRCPNTYPYRPQIRRLVNYIICVTLLLIKSRRRQLNFGVHVTLLLLGSPVSTCSARNKVASLHDLINDFSIDLLALPETRLQSDLLNAVRGDTAPEGPRVLHSYRCTTASRTSDGGFALVYRNTFPAISGDFSFVHEQTQLQSTRRWQTCLLDERARRLSN